MKTHKLKIELPDRAAITAGLTPRDLHPPLVRAEQVAADAERELERKRRELAGREQLVAELPGRIHRGEARSSALSDALRDRDAAALLIPAAEQALAKARERVPVEEKAAKAAVEREFNRRAELLERAAAEVSPLLAEISDLADALGVTRGLGYMLASVEWPDSPSTMAQFRVLSRGGST